MDGMTEQQETYSDAVLGFAIPSHDARGRAVRLEAALDEILSAHKYPPAITHLLAEALVLTALVGGLLKHEGDQLTMQAQTENGVVKLLVCDYKDGDLRGYVDFDEDRLAELGTNPPLYALFGQGFLALTFDMQGEKGRYQGVVPLEGENLADAVQNYFYQSEQMPTLIRVGAHASESGCIAGGILLQYMPDGEEGRERLHTIEEQPEWEHITVLGGTTKRKELVDPSLSLEALVWRLFHDEDEVRVFQPVTVQRGCRCSAEHYEKVLARFPPEDRADMQDENGVIPVDCAFCSRVFPIKLKPVHRQ